MQVTDFLHQAIRLHLESTPTLCIDATLGNGFDLRFMYQLMKSGGTLYGFDVQRPAIEKARDLESKCQFPLHISIHHHCHTQIASRILPAHRGNVDLIMFNLGYLPGYAKHILTRAPTSLLAFQRAWDMLRIGGIISVVCYPGHLEGKRESDLFHQLIQTKPWTQRWVDGYCAIRNNGPFGLIFKKT